MSLTTNPNDPRLGHGSDDQPRPQNEVYLVLSAEERAKGFVRPVRHTYQHVGDKPKYPLRDLTAEEQVRHAGMGYVKYEAYPESESPLTGKFWTLDALTRPGCGGITTMGQALAETYARNPQFYGSTYCAVCGMHRPVSEFVWVGDRTVVGA